MIEKETSKANTHTGPGMMAYKPGGDRRGREGGGEGGREGGGGVMNTHTILYKDTRATQNGRWLLVVGESFSFGAIKNMFSLGGLQEDV